MFVVGAVCAHGNQVSQQQLVRRFELALMQTLTVTPEVEPIGGTVATGWPTQ